MIRFSYSNKDTKDAEEKRRLAVVRRPLYYYAQRPQPRWSPGVHCRERATTPSSFYSFDFSAKSILSKDIRKPYFPHDRIWMHNQVKRNAIS
jgi:hypothetical protein